MVVRLLLTFSPALCERVLKQERQQIAKRTKLQQANLEGVTDELTSIQKRNAQLELDLKNTRQLLTKAVCVLPTVFMLHNLTIGLSRTD